MSRVAFLIFCGLMLSRSLEPNWDRSIEHLFMGFGVLSSLRRVCLPFIYISVVLFIFYTATVTQLIQNT